MAPVEVFVLIVCIIPLEDSVKCVRPISTLNKESPSLIQQLVLVSLIIMHNYTLTIILLIACGCHIPGVTNDGDCARENSTSVQIGDCICKENVVGRTCSECAPGYFNLSVANPQGCQGV